MPVVFDRQVTLWGRMYRRANAGVLTKRAIEGLAPA